jgi:hypothetical protein
VISEISLNSGGRRLMKKRRTIWRAQKILTLKVEAHRVKEQ